MKPGPGDHASCHATILAEQITIHFFDRKFGRKSRWSDNLLAGVVVRIAIDDRSGRSVTKMCIEANEYCIWRGWGEVVRSPNGHGCPLAEYAANKPANILCRAHGIGRWTKSKISNAIRLARPPRSEPSLRQYFMWDYELLSVLFISSEPRASSFMCKWPVLDDERHIAATHHTRSYIAHHSLAAVAIKNAVSKSRIAHFDFISFCQHFI